MRILGWNCRGICNASTARALRATIRAQNPDFVFLCETKVFDDDRLKKLAVSIGFSEQLIVNAKGKAGGVCLLWSSALDVEVLEFNSRTIAVVVNDVLCSWALIGFYGPPYQAKRRKAWENLHALLQSLNCPWICFGDFNVVVEESEKFGGQRGSNSTPSYLKDLLFDLGAIDLGFAGAKYTWWNKRWGKNAIKERLDRAICNSGWRTQFPKASVFHLEATNSDHAPLLIDSNPKEEFLLRPFRFEAMWTRDPRCGGVVKEA
jgi:exonuclease III